MDGWMDERMNVFFSSLPRAISFSWASPSSHGVGGKEQETWDLKRKAARIIGNPPCASPQNV
jgi:hypothetical protein